jgi:hypothetical protein
MHSEESSHHSRGDPAHGRLTNYGRKLTWSWDYDEREHKVMNCVLEKNEKPQASHIIRR